MVRKDLLDELDRRILVELERDARASHRAIARRLNVSAPTVAQRIRRMEEVGMIRGYRVEVALPAGETRERTLASLKCSECKGEIHGPVRTRRFNGKSFAFCCLICEGTFAERIKRLTGGAKGVTAAFLLIGWTVSFGALAASCMGMGGCPTSTVTPVPYANPCSPWLRPREDESVVPQEHESTASLKSFHRPTRSSRMVVASGPIPSHLG